MSESRVGTAVEAGQGIVEYALILGLVAIAAIGALVVLGGSIGQGLETTLDAFQGEYATLLQDDFNGNSTLDWQYIWGSWREENGRLVSDDRWSKAVAPLPGKDYTFSLDLQTIESTGNNSWDVTRVVFRFQDVDNYYAVVPKTDGVLELAKMQAGNWQPWLAYADAGVDPSQSHNYKVSVIGSHIQVWMDGAKYIDYTDPNPIPDGGIGVSNDWSLGAFDNVAVQMEGD